MISWQQSKTLNDEQSVLLHGPKQKYTHLADPWNLLSGRFVAMGGSASGKSFLVASVLWFCLGSLPKCTEEAACNWRSGRPKTVRVSTNRVDAPLKIRTFIAIFFYCNFPFLFQIACINSEERRSHWTPELSSVTFPTFHNMTSFFTLHGCACKSHLAHSHEPVDSAISAWQWTTIFSASPSIPAHVLSSCEVGWSSSGKNLAVGPSKEENELSTLLCIPWSFLLLSFSLSLFCFISAYLFISLLLPWKRWCSLILFSPQPSS